MLLQLGNLLYQLYGLVTDYLVYRCQRGLLLLVQFLSKLINVHEVLVIYLGEWDITLLLLTFLTAIDDGCEFKFGVIRDRFLV